MVFLAGLICGLVAVILGWLWFQLKRPAEVSGAAGLHNPLPGLDAKWTFKDSWAANVTLVSAIFTGLFGTSDLLKSTLGEEAPGVLSVITIASAIAVAVVGVAPLLLQALRDDESQVLVGGLLVSAALAVGASAGLVLAIASSVAPMLAGKAHTALCSGVIIALFILALYADTSVRQNLTTGLKPKKDEQKKVAVKAVQDAVQRNLDENQIREEVLPKIQPTADRPAALI
jgi:hypothetical protein